MATRLYFHAATNATSGLPTTEQSTLTANGNFDALTLNRSMNPTIGTSLATSTEATNATTSSQNYYFHRFVSEPLNQTSIAANTWTYTVALQPSNAAANFPTHVTPTRVNCYVWRPSNSTKVGTILEGTTIGNLNEVAPGNITGQLTTFSGSAVSSIVAGDVIIFEVWFITVQDDATSYNISFYYDGTSAVTGFQTKTSPATYIETPENLTFQSVTTTVSQTSIQKYALKKNILQASIQKYSLRAYVLRTSIHKYGMGGTVLSTIIQKYNISKYLAQINKHKYNIFKTVAATISIQKYGLRKNVAQVSIHKYKMTKQIVQTSIHRYHIFSLTGPIFMTIEAVKTFRSKFLTKL